MCAKDLPKMFYNIPCTFLPFDLSACVPKTASLYLLLHVATHYSVDAKLFFFFFENGYGQKRLNLMM